MTRPDKRAARFGDRYRPPLDWRRFHGAVKAGLPLIHRMTEAFRRYGEAMQDWREIGTMGEDGIPSIEGPIVMPPGARVIGTESGIYFSGDWTGTVISGVHVANMAAPTLAELQAGTPIGGITFEHTDPSPMGRWLRNENARRFPAETYAITTAVAISGPFAPWESDEPDILDRIDETLTSYDATSQPGDRPWPYESF